MKFFKKTDIIAIAAIIAAAAAIWLIYSQAASGRPVKAEIYYYSQLVETVELAAGREKVFSVPQDDDVVLRIDANGSIQFIESDCPDKVCIKTGRIHLAGQSAACLPNGIVVKIVPADGWNGDEPDIIIGSGGKQTGSAQ
ncbi:MAG: NusG domain II-containing protein [Clostridiaceae bacterium]|jgi:hypothetical protein|nr:NusG domain II-containing protein [Clostridiaceae bacterium]